MKKENPYSLAIQIAFLQLLLVLQMLLPVLHHISHMDAQNTISCSIDESADPLCKLTADKGVNPLAQHIGHSASPIYTLSALPVISFSTHEFPILYNRLDGTVCLPDITLPFTTPPPQVA